MLSPIPSRPLALTVYCASSKRVAQSYLESRARLGFPMAPKAWADEVTAQLAARRPGADAKQPA